MDMVYCLGWVGIQGSNNHACEHIRIGYVRLTDKVDRHPGACKMKL